MFVYPEPPFDDTMVDRFLRLPEHLPMHVSILLLADRR